MRVEPSSQLRHARPPPIHVVGCATRYDTDLRAAGRGFAVEAKATGRRCTWEVSWAPALGAEVRALWHGIIDRTARR
jgi:hypothetical protein